MTLNFCSFITHSRAEKTFLHAGGCIWLKEKSCRVCKVHFGGGVHLEEIRIHRLGHQKRGAMLGAENRVYSKREVNQIASCYGKLHRASCRVSGSEMILGRLVILPNNTREANKSLTPLIN